MVGLEGLVEPNALVEEVHTGGSWFEGPTWLPWRGALRWSDIPEDRILEYSTRTNRTTVYASGVEFVNGRTLDRDGSVVQCSHGRRRVERDRDGTVTEIVGTWSGHRLNSPNDVVIAPDGAIWFTDPFYGITQPNEGHPGDLEYGDQWVFRVDPVTGDAVPVVTDVEEPNGLAFSPDGNVFYVADSSAIRKPSGVGNRWIRAYDVVDGRRCKNGRVFAAIDHGVADGIAVDDLGNVWSSSFSGVRVFSPRGELLGRILLPQIVGNLCFGGPDGHDLWIAATDRILRLRTLRTDAWAAATRA
ncbi:SMP-30/gluconolactonase/LRE family protein [Sinomonas terrae]|uniref:SMP-30/gluconolactonase/LRE family protein n=1 Tax=Sinomonas terrae TaxID=2908838 RepID=A0ABS9U053_9MICC|nr:SMP-30/gluconolactonase/LRE family protein [Sinomonas terrae]MCH6470064.1 SMP-30/gluconolactonase/LRE family protein [Sinomonas terrae]